MARKSSIEKFEKVRKEIGSDQRKPVYFLCGEEDFFLDGLQEKVESLVPENQKDFNFDLIYGNDASVEQVLGIARSYPMMAKQRVVIVRDFYSLRGGVSDPEEESPYGGGGDLDELIPYLEQPNQSCLLILISNRKPNGRTRLGKAIKKNDSVGYVEFSEVPDYRLPEWIAEWTKKKHNKHINPDAAEVLAQYVGNNLLLLSTEIDKLATFKEDTDTLTEEDIKKVIGKYREYSVFELKDAVMARDLDQSLFIAEQMIQLSRNDTGEVIKTVGFFYSVFSNIWQILRLRKKGFSKNEIQDRIGVNNSWYFNKLWEDASGFRLGEMARIFEALLDADSSAKGFSQMDASSIFIFMIERIIGKQISTK